MDWLSARPIPDDKRQTLIAVTDAGRDLIVHSRRQRDEWLTRRLADLSVTERETVAAAIPLLDQLAASPHTST